MVQARGKLTWLTLLALVGLGAALSCVSPAVAGFGSGCTGSGTAQFQIDPDGTSVAVSLGFHDTGATNDLLGERQNTAGKSGKPWDGTSSCGLSSGETF